MKKYKVIISGGGTGGHIFPALSIANALKEIDSEIDILFVGAIGRMEMERVPAAGYPIKGLPVAGLKRSLSLSNLALPIKLWKSIRGASKIIKEFNPDVAVGVGGYASAPLLWSAGRKGIPYLIQEQNSYAGLTNKLLGKKASKVCVAYDNMDRFFPADRIILTGNPIRKEINKVTAEDRAEGIKFYNLDPEKKTIFIVGGSLGCGTLNKTMKSWIESGTIDNNCQIIWQTGKYYKSDIDEFMKDREIPNVQYHDFIKRMDLAYAAADVIVSRAGAGTISELCVTCKATIFVPSPNVTEDHQTHNAMALVNKNAAMIVKDDEAVEKLPGTIMDLVNNPSKIAELEKNIELLGKKDAAQVIANEVLKLIKK
ncbi:MAG: undecaprenyldiphospho-muramoylpentapeptide beta-N-acetylglucosaminyltransferase [Bacteroidales bacterium]|nr:undecaprenyldiphospho-muramoylpentapeptide beta-N-acetylglucosaminyltransferase [Bacteroidales bacterium]